MCGFDKPGGKTKPLRGFSYCFLLQIRPQPSRGRCLSPSPFPLLPSPPKGAGSIGAPPPKPIPAPNRAPPTAHARPLPAWPWWRDRGEVLCAVPQCSRKAVFFSPSAVAERRPPSSSQAAPPALTVSRGSCPGTGSSSPPPPFPSLPPAGRACAASAPPLVVALREKRGCACAVRRRGLVAAGVACAHARGGGLVGACWGRVPPVLHLLRAGVGLKVL